MINASLSICSSRNPQNIAITAPLAAGHYEYNFNNFNKLNFNMSYPTRINITQDGIKLDIL